MVAIEDRQSAACSHPELLFTFTLGSPHLYLIVHIHFHSYNLALLCVCTSMYWVFYVQPVALVLISESTIQSMLGMRLSGFSAKLYFGLKLCSSRQLWCECHLDSALMLAVC